MVTTRVDVWTQAGLPRDGTWLPLASGRSAEVVLKPNWVRDFNERDPSDARLLEHTVTSPAALRAVAGALKGRAAALVIADAPQFDTRWDRLAERLDFANLGGELSTLAAAPVTFCDLRQEVVITDPNGVILSREVKQRDPHGYRVVDLGDLSAFAEAGFDTQNLRGADFDASETIRHHSGGRHEYCVAGTILNADWVVDVPKMKTHKKAGVTLCLKNLVGINGNKNFLPHHRAGTPTSGGDEFPATGTGFYRRARAWAIDRARPILQRGWLTPLIRGLRSVDVRTRPASMIRNGNWWGNDTIWRTILDLNRILLYSDSRGAVQRTVQREVTHVIDGITAGEGDGPMAPDRREPGLLIVSTDAVAADVTAAALMGFEPARIPVIQHACAPHPLPITRLGQSFENLELFVDGVRLDSWRELPNHRFRPHPGWTGRIEREVSARGRADMRAEAGR